MLSQTGLFSDVAAGTLAPGVREYAPAYELWSDGATKRRWVHLPAGQKIDTTKMDYWVYPVGTKLWKEFTRDGQRVETRMIEKHGTGKDDWFMMAFEWNDTGTDAAASDDGAMNAEGTAHDIPGHLKCWECHGNMKDRVLGFSAIQLSHTGAGVTLDTLIAEGLLSAPPVAAFTTLPGAEQEKKALGYMHANCGTCHNDGGTSGTVRLDEARALAAHFGARLTGGHRELSDVDRGRDRVVQGDRRRPRGRRDLASSILYQRFIHEIGTELHMPPLGTEVVDPDGRQILEDWIGYLGPPQ